MPPKRASQRATRSRATSSVVSVDVDREEQTMRETFDVASLPMDEAGTTISQQRQQALRSPSWKQEKRKTPGKPKKSSSAAAATAAASAQQQQQHQGASGEGDEGGVQPAADVTTDHVGGVSSGGSLAEHTLESLLAGGASVASTADSVLNLYRRGDQAAALCALLNLVAKAAGVQEVELDGNALADGMDIAPLLEELYARVPVDSAAYALVNKEARYRRFRKTFPEFADKLVRLAWSADVLLDGVLLPTLAQWVISMSESKSRSFRHTATVMLLGLLQGLNALHADLTERVTLARTRKERTELEGALDEVARWRDHFFSQGIHQRVRDVAPEIRLCVFQCLKRWVLEYKEEYMTNKYLRYFGMPLHDKRPDLRAEGLDMIWQALFTVPEAYGRMHLFLQYFVNRLVEMSDDVDVRCAELAIRVVAMLVREDSEVAEGNELIQNTMIDRVLLTLFDERPTIRAAAGVLLKVFIHCRTADEETEEEQVRVATELLCSFASTLRGQYAERMPERYLIDALWAPERLPLLLTEYEPMLKVARAAEATSVDVNVGLGLLTALLAKIRGRLTLGPAPKDDRRGVAAAARPLPPSTQETVHELARRISVDLAAALSGILEHHRGDPAVLAAVGSAVAVLDLGACTGGRQARQLEAVLLALRKATAAAPADEAVRDAVVAAWHSVVGTEHPLQTSARGHLSLLQEQVLQQVAKAEEAAGGDGAARLAAWARLNLVSALVPVGPQWSVVRAALARQLAAVGAGGADAGDDDAVAQAFEILEWMLGTAVNGVLWNLSEEAGAEERRPSPVEGEDGGDAGTAAPAAAAHGNEHLSDAMACLLECLGAGDAVLRESAAAARPAVVAAIASLRTRAFVHLCDLGALRLYNLSQSEQEMLVDAFDSLFEYWAAQLRVAQDGAKVTVSQQLKQQRGSAADGAAGAVTLSQVAVARQQVSHTEASQMRLVTGVARLFLLMRLDAALAPRVLAQWTQTTSKAVSDVFKGLLHVLRDRAGDSFYLERDILITAHTRCAEVGATPVSVDALYQIGMKLASMHFASTDRFYAAVVGVVRFATDFAATTDPLILHGALPYCSKLRTADALHLVRHDLAARELFTSVTSPYVRVFVAAMRKAARLEEYLAGSSAVTGVKRPRGAGDSALPEAEREDLLLRDGARSVSARGEADAAVSGRAPADAADVHAVQGALPATARVVGEDGWREAASSQPPAGVDRSLSPRRRGKAAGGAGLRGPIDMPTSQEMALSSLADGVNTEAFIATEEFD